MSNNKNNIRIMITFLIGMLLGALTGMFFFNNKKKD